ncbi:hypothetical protein CsSME_00035327 [Camellia sinensis var. sinensis]
MSRKGSRKQFLQSLSTTGQKGILTGPYRVVGHGEST